MQDQRYLESQVKLIMYQESKKTEADEDSSSVAKTMNHSQISLKGRGLRSDERSNDRSREGQAPLHSSKYLGYNSNAPKSGLSELSLSKHRPSRNRLNQDAVPPFTQSQQNILSQRAFKNASSSKSFPFRNMNISESREQEKHQESECNVDQDEADELRSDAGDCSTERQAVQNTPVQPM